MPKKLLSAIVLFCALNNITHAQNLIVPKSLKLPGDTVQNTLLITSLDGLLGQIDKPNKDNAFVAGEYLSETSVLLDEMRGMENEGVDKKGLYKCYLTDICPLDSAGYLVEFAYMGTNGMLPVLKASFEVLAERTGDHYSFYSPLKRNTATWTTKKVGKFTCRYKTTLYMPAVDNYVKKAAEFDRKLHAPDYVNQLYFCDDVQTALYALGVTYKADYSALAHDNFSSFEKNQSLIIFGTTSADPEALDIHDCWHLRLRYSVAAGTTNRFVDEGCAYLYGGSWGLSWPYIIKKFKAAMGDDKNWLTAYTVNKQFGDSQEKHLYVAYVINALLAQKIEKEKGFDGVIQFVTSGKRQKDEENYFAALNKIIGVNRSNFNVVVEKLVEAAP